MSANRQATVLESGGARWVRLARAAWFPAAIAAAVVYLASIPGYLILIPGGFAPGGSMPSNPSALVLILNGLAGILSMGAALLSLALAQLLFRRRPEDPMALYLSYFLLVYGILVAGPLDTVGIFLPDTARRIAQGVVLLVSVPFFFFLFALFPDGRFVPRWSRWLALASFTLVPVILLTFPSYSLHISNPRPAFLSTAGFLVTFLFLTGLLVAQIHRFRYISTRPQKIQTKWVVYGLGLMLTMLAVSSIPQAWSFSRPPGDRVSLWSAVASVLYFLSFTILPLSLSVAVLRFRLYDIDLIINHTLVYGALTAGVVAVYLLLVTMTGLVFQSGSELAGALLTILLIVAGYRPLRAGLQRGADRLTYGRAGPSPIDPGDPPAETMPAFSSARTTDPTRARSGGWIRVARLAWVPTAALALGIFTVAIPGYFILGSGGTIDHRFSANPSPWVSVFTWITLMGSLATAFISLFLATLLFKRRADDGMALLISFFLLVQGVVIGGPLEALEYLYPGIAEFTTEFLIPGFVPVSLFLFAVFPDGRFVPRWIKWMVLAAFLGIPIPILLSASVGPSPLDLSAPGVSTAVVVGVLLALMIWFSILYAQIHRFRNVSTPQQRQQTKWVVYGVGIWLTLQIISSIPWIFAFTLPPGTPYPIWLAAAGPLWSISIAIIPITLTIAVLRFRLFEIDFLINRSLVYGGLTAIVIAVYILVVGALGAFFQAQDNLLIALLATGLVAVIFQPLRARLQQGVNRMMFGDRDDPVEAIARLGRRLEASLAPEAVLPTLVETIAQSLELPYAAIHLLDESGEQVAAAYGELSYEPIRFPLMFQGEAVGFLVVGSRDKGESFNPSEMRLLRNVARQAGAAVHAVQLTADLQRSRRQLVASREEERRRLRRDLHDGLGPTLAALHIQTKALRRLIQQDPLAAEEMVEEFKTEIREAIGDIRRVVYELRPPTLDEFGLVGATRAYAANCSRAAGESRATGVEVSGEQGFAVDVIAPGALPALPAAIEVAAYHIVREALTNVVHHARAQRCEVRFEVGEALEIGILDDGVGLPAKPNAGIGLLSMRERAEEVGGSLVIEPGPGGGTRVWAEFPLGET